MLDAYAGFLDRLKGALQNEAIKMSEVWSPKRVSKPRSLLYS